MKMHLGILAMVTAGFLAGCAGFGFDEAHSWDEGWRKGTIVEVGKGDAIASKVATKCQQGAVSTPMKGTYATVKYGRLRRSATRTLPVSEDLALKVGDPVFINSQNCNSPVELRKP